MLDGTALREPLQAVLPRSVIEEESRELGMIERDRQCEAYPLITSLVLSSGSDESGRTWRHEGFRSRACFPAKRGIERGTFLPPVGVCVGRTHRPKRDAALVAVFEKLTIRLSQDRSQPSDFGEKTAS